MRKTLLTIIAVAALVFSASAQQKGEQYVGLNLDYNTGTSSLLVNINNRYDDKSTSRAGDNLGAGIDYGYFVANNLLLKAHIGYGYEKQGLDISHSLNIAPGLAYYVKIANGFYYTPNISVAYAMSSTKQTDDSYLTLNGFGVELQPFAVEFRPTKRFAMNISLASLQYVYLMGKIDTGDLLDATIDINGFSFDLLANAQIGFKLYF